MDARIITGAQTVTRVQTDDHWLAWRGMRDGSAIVAPWLTALAIEGRVFAANVGTGTSPTTFNATFAAAEQDFFLHVPAGTTVIPVYIGIQFEDTGTAQVLDVFAAASATGDAAVTGTAITIRNMRSDAPFSSACTATAVVTAAGTDTNTGNYVEFWRPYGGFGEDAFNGSTGWVNSRIHGSEWIGGQTLVPPIIVGAGSLAVFASGQAATGWIQVMWIEVSSTSMAS